ncbi:MAG: HYR domain-containing protein, partial [Vicingaceae bacterium]|nr:HYR domain-containing protein [Vicingaceae bacterium]
STDASGETFNLGVTNVKYYIYDLAGNVDSCRFTVTVIDSVAPTISCPGNISLSTPNNNCDILVTGIAPITPNDNCAIDSVSYVLSGTTIGNGLNDASGAVFNLGVTNVKYYIYDLAGNVDSCSFTVTVIDSVPPTIACPGNIILSTSINSCDTIINGIAPISTMDNCAIDSVNYVLTGVTTSSGSTDASGETFNLGLTNVKYYIYDLAGNVDSCSFTVTVIDSVPPSITCPGSISLATSVNSCDTVVNGIAPISTIDNCAIDSVNYVLTGVTTSSGSTDASGETFNVGLTNVKYYIYDLAGNVDSCSFNVNVIDSIAPSITCPGNITLSTSVNSCDTIVNGIAPTSTNDNCAIDSVNYALTGATIGFGTGDASGNSFNLGVTNVLYFVYDLSGNVDSCNFSITVIDSIPPVISCPNNISISNDSGFCSAVVNSIAPLIITDNCSIDSVGYKLNGATTGNGLNDASGLTYNIGITTVIYYIYDLAGNTDSCSFTVTVTDNENPIITCPGNIVICDTNVIVPTPTFGDNCMVNTVTNDFNGLSNASGIYPYGITTVNWTVTDTSGNMSTCPMTIEVEVPPFSDAGPDQKLVGVNTTSLDGSTPVNGIGSWLNVSGYGFIQSVNDPKSILEDLDPGINVFEWIVSYGTCLDSIDEVEIEYIPLKIPNGFSPNNDGDNDQLVITGIDLIENELVIFNRWGVELFSQYNYQNDWEGKSKDGKELPEDTYFYILKIPELEKEFSGYIVLKR